MQQEEEQDHRINPPPEDAVLYDSYGQAVFAYVRLHTSTREDAEDITLDVFLAALEHDNLSAIAVNERLAWLRRVAHNKIVDSYRRGVRHPTIALNERTETLIMKEMDAPEPQLLRREQYEELTSVIKKLPLLQQQLLRLRYGDGLRCTEIAILMNKREEAVRKLLSRTLALLRATYQKQIEEGEAYV